MDYILLGAISANLFGKSTVLLYVLFSLMIIFYIIKRKKILMINKSMLILILFSVSYAVISFYYNKGDLFLLLGPILAFYIGRMICNKKEGAEGYITKCIFSIAIGFFLHAMLNYFTNTEEIGRNTIDFWTKEMMAATLQATMLTMIMSTLFYTLFYIKEWKYKIVMLIFIILAFTYDMILATRTLLIITASSFLVSWLVYTCLNKKYKNMIKSVLVIAILWIAFVSIYENNLLEIKEKVEESNLFSRMNDDDTISSDEGRFQTQIIAIQSLWQYPFGGNHELIGNLRYAHNMWLDVAKQTGIIPFVLLIIFFVTNIIQLIKVIKSKDVTEQFKVLLIGIYISVILNFLVEPILQGIPLYFVCFTIIMGLVDGKAVLLKK